MESTATSVAVDLSIAHRQSCFSWTQDKVSHCVLNLKHSKVGENCETESRFSIVSHDASEHSGSDVDHEHSDSDVDHEDFGSDVYRNPFATDLRIEERKVASHYIQSHIKVEDYTTGESNTSPDQTSNFFFSSDTFDDKVSYPRTSEVSTPISELQEQQDQKSHIICKKVIVPPLVKDDRILNSGAACGNLASVLPTNFDFPTKNRQSESLNCSGIKNSENDVKLPIRMVLKLNSTGKLVQQKVHGNTTPVESLSAVSQNQEVGTYDVQQNHENSVKSAESVQAIKEESLGDVSLMTNSCAPQKLSVNFDHHNGILKDNDSDISDGKVDSGDSSDGDTPESIINGTDDSKISLDNDAEDEADYKFVVRYPLRCVVCSRDFLYRAEYIQHCSLHESYDENILFQVANLPEPIKSEDDLPFYCEICGKGFMNKQAIKHHFIIHTDERPHTCNICKKSYRHRSALYKHKRSHTDVLAYACDVCGKRFKHKSYLNIHAVIHTQQRPYSCNICGSTFRDRSARNKHLHAHSGVRPYSCEVCGKCFGRKGDYKSHSVIHTEQRPYKCDVCGRGFRSSSNYHRHSRTHTSDCPFKCDICEKSFNQNWKLKEHKFVHSDKLPYVCDICGDGFKYPRKYKQHMENHARERLHNQVTTASTDQQDEPAYEVMDVQPDISLLLEQ